jgi:putative glutamine amidotransferase
LIANRSDEPAAGRPVVGVCAAWDVAGWGFWRQPAAIVAGTYLDAVTAVGGLPIALLPTELAPGDAAALIKRVDGLLLVGGSDLDPSSFGECRSTRTEATSPLRDRFELELVREAFRVDLPTLGICRGLQIMNVASGGTLHHHLVDEGYLEHRPLPGRLDEPTFHEVEVLGGTLLGGRGATVSRAVNSHHHQGVAEVGSFGQVSARSIPDGAIEAVEWSLQRFALGVQWHPEALELDPTLAGFVAAASRSRAAAPAEVLA